MKRNLRYLLIVLIIILTFQILFTGKSYAGSYKIEAENFEPTYNIDLNGEKALAQRILGYIRNITAVASVLIIAFLGLKFMIGSAEERAEYKKSFIPLIIGILIVVAATTFMDIVWNIDKGGPGTVNEHIWSYKDEFQHECKDCGITGDHLWRSVKNREQCSICGAVKRENIIETPE